MLRSLLLTLVALPALAAPRDFPFTWNTRTLQSGHDGVEAWLTPHLERTPDYGETDLRFAWSHGFTDTVEQQLSLDVDIVHTSADENASPKVSSLWRWAAYRSDVFSFAGLGRVSLGTRKFEAEARLIADVNIGSVLFSFNIGGSRAALWDGLTGANTHLEGNIGARYAFSSFASIGVESWSKTGWDNAKFVGSAVYVGPTLTLSFEHFWLSLGLQAQIVGFKGKDDTSTDTQELRDNERYVLRLAIGGQ